jgi:hypothetical protein
MKLTGLLPSGQDVAEEDLLDIGSIDALNTLDGGCILLLALNMRGTLRVCLTLDGVGSELRSGQARQGATKQCQFSPAERKVQELLTQGTSPRVYGQ